MKGRGNPWHDARGRFCSGPQGRTAGRIEPNDYPQSDFVSAKTKKEAESFTRSMGIKPHFGGMSLESCNAINESVSEAIRRNPSSVKFIKNVGSTDSICDGYTTEMHTAYRKSLDRTVGTELSEQEKDRIADDVTAVSRRQLQRNDNAVATIPPGENQKNREISKVLNKYSGIYISKRAENMNTNDIKTHILKALMQEKTNG